MDDETKAALTGAAIGFFTSLLKSAFKGESLAKTAESVTLGTIAAGMGGLTADRLLGNGPVGSVGGAVMGTILAASFEEKIRRGERLFPPGWNVP